MELRDCTPSFERDFKFWEASDRRMRMAIRDRRILHLSTLPILTEPAIPDSGTDHSGEYLGDAHSVRAQTSIDRLPDLIIALKG